MRHCLHPSAAVLLCAAMLAACGGDGGSLSSLPGAVQIPAYETELSSHTASLTLAAGGRTRYFDITNSGDRTAQNLQITVLQGLPGDASVDLKCTELPPGSRCVLDITPGTTPSAAPATDNPPAAVLRLQGSNTGPLDLAVRILDFGSLHQGGYVFAMDDGTAAWESIGGKVLRLEQGKAPWFADANGFASNESIGTDSFTEGAFNSSTLVEFADLDQVPRDRYAAGICADSVAAAHTDWYLPAICELGDNRNGNWAIPPSTCTGSLQTVQSNLLDRYPPGTFGSLDGALWWSSTEKTPSPNDDAFYFAPNTGLLLGDKRQSLNVACVRRLTP